MRVTMIFFLWFMFLFISIYGQNNEHDFYKLKIMCLDNNIVVTSGTQFNTNQIAIKTIDGIILFDTGISPKHAEAIKDSLAKILRTDNFLYIINTHHHWDHLQGNQVFKDSKIVGHRNIKDAMKKQAQISSANAIPIFVKKDSSSVNIPPPPPSHILTDGINGFNATGPTIIVEDSLHLKIGDLDLKIYHLPYFHSNNDLIISIEKLGIIITGDIFFNKSLPSLQNFSGTNYFKWNKIFGNIFEEQNKLRFVIPGHNEIISPKDFRAYCDYITKTGEEVTNLTKADQSLENILVQCKLANLFPELTNYDLKSNNGSSLHDGNIKYIYNSLTEHK